MEIRAGAILLGAILVAGCVAEAQRRPTGEQRGSEGPLPPVASSRGMHLAPSARLQTTRVRGSASMVLGALDRSLVDAEVQRHFPAISDCTDDTPSPGQLDVRLVIDPSGKVSHRALRRAASDTELAACVLERFRQMRFPAPKGGGAVVVGFPLRWGADPGG